jgi:pentatricopeptide repeat protein
MHSCSQASRSFLWLSRHHNLCVELLVAQDMELAGQEPNSHVYNALLFALLESRKLDEASLLLQRMKRLHIADKAQTRSLLQRYGLGSNLAPLL